MAIQPDMLEALIGLGLSYKELGSLKQAEEAFEAVLRLQPGNALALGNIAGLYFDQGKMPQVRDSNCSASVCQVQATVYKVTALGQNILFVFTGAAAEITSVVACKECHVMHAGSDCIPEGDQTSAKLPRGVQQSWEHSARAGAC